MKRFFWTIFLIFLWFNTHGYVGIGTPQYRFYSPQDYKAGNRNWAIVSDEQGIIYVANDDGILRFDGIYWDLIELPENQIAYWLAKGSDGIIYVGANGEFGRLVPDEDGTMIYESFLTKIDGKYLDFNVVWEIAPVSSGVLFRSRDYVFFHSEGEITPLEVPEGGRAFDVAYAARDTVFGRVYGLGLVYMDKNGVGLLPNSEFFAEKKVNGIYAYGEDELLVATRFEGIYIYNKTGVRRFENACHDYLVSNKIYDGHHMANGNYAMSTMGNGIIILDPQGQEVFRFDASNGLGKQRPLYVSEINGQLWIGMKNGIYAISYATPYKFIKQDYGITGQITDILRYQDDLFVTCNDGFYMLDDKGALPSFNAINKNLIVDCVDLFEYNDKLLVTSLEGIYEYSTQGNLKELTNFNARELTKTDHPDVLVASGFYFGAAVLFMDNNNITVSEVPGIDRSVRQVIDIGDDSFLLRTINNQLFEIKLDVSNQSVSITNELKLPNGSQLVKFNDEIFVITIPQVYELSGDSLTATSQAIDFSFDARKLVLIEQAQENASYLCYEDQLGNYYCDLITYNNGVFDASGDYFYSEFKPEVITRDDDDLLVGGVAGIKLIESNVSLPDMIKEEVFVRRVSFGNDWVVISPQPGDHYELRPNITNIQFDFSSFSGFSDDVYYQYRLNGLSEEWTRWDVRKSAIYNGLRPGYYTFQVRSISLNGSRSDVSHLSFVIPYPWYASWYAIVLYIIGAVTIIYLVYQRRVRYLKMRQDILQKLVQEKTHEISATNKQLADKARRLEELDNFKSRFFANIMHDLRTPVTLLSGRVKQLMEDKDSFFSTPAEKFISSMEKVSQKLVAMTGDIGELVAMEEGNLKLSKRPVNIGSYVKVVAGLFHSAAEIKGIEVRVEVDEIEDYYVLLDPEKFDRVMFNLISNSLKYTSARGKIVVEVLPDGDDILVKVSDDGIGIPVDHISQVFDRNFQASNNAKASEGMGIGLSVAKEIVELHDGRISVQSMPFKGATFTVRLPSYEYYDEEQAVAPSEFIVHREKQLRDELETMDVVPSAPTVSQESLAKKRILLVEDHPEVRQYLAELLSTNYHVLVAGNGSQALRKLQKMEVDLIITDLMMPVMDGFEFIDGLKENPALQHIPIMVVSARSNKDDKYKILSKGVTDILVKPFDKDELILRIEKLVYHNNPQEEGIKKAVSNFATYENIQLQKLNSVILDEIDNSNVTALLLADKLNTTERSLYRLVKKITGKTPNEYVKDIKFQYAYDLILARKVNSVKQVATEIGMSNSTNFNKQFSKRFGKRAEELLQ